METLSISPSDYDVFIGIDVDKSSYSFTVSDHFQKMKSKTIPSNAEHLYTYIQKVYGNRKVICAYEAGPTGFHLYDVLNEKSIPCIVTSPASVPKASNDRVKTNRIDSRKIVTYLMSGDIKPVRVPEDSFRELRHLIRIRENYARDKKTAKQRIKGLLLYAHLCVDIKDLDQNWSGRYIQELKRISCSFAERHRLDGVLADLQHARERLISTQKTLKEFCKEHPEINAYMGYLMSIPGIGFTTAITLLGNIGNPKYLRSPRELSSFVGLTPSEHSTGDKIQRGSITHLGNKHLRHMLIEAAWVTIRHDTSLAQFYHRIKNKHHSRFAKKIAITAVARKLTQIIYRVLKDKRDYIQY
jgi:transposase